MVVVVAVGWLVVTLTVELFTHEVCLVKGFGLAGEWVDASETVRGGGLVEGWCSGVMGR